MLDHRVLLPDEYDRINSDIEPFWAAHPSILRSTQAARESQPVIDPRRLVVILRSQPFQGTFTISNVKGKVAISGLASKEPSAFAQSQMEMLEAVAKSIPDFRATFNAGETPTYVTHPHDHPSADHVSRSELINYELRRSAREAAREGKCTSRPAVPDRTLTPLFAQ